MFCTFVSLFVVLFQVAFVLVYGLSSRNTHITVDGMNFASKFLDNLLSLRNTRVGVKESLLQRLHLVIMVPIFVLSKIAQSLNKAFETDWEKSHRGFFVFTILNKWNKGFEFIVAKLF